MAAATAEHPNIHQRTNTNNSNYTKFMEGFHLSISQCVNIHICTYIIYHIYCKPIMFYISYFMKWKASPFISVGDVLGAPSWLRSHGPGQDTWHPYTDNASAATSPKETCWTPPCRKTRRWEDEDSRMRVGKKMNDKKWMNEGMKDRMNKWMNEWMNEWTNKQTNKQTNEIMNDDGDWMIERVDAWCMMSKNNW